MTDIALHAHSDVGWVSWRTSNGFGRIHLMHPDTTATLCYVAIPNATPFVRVVRDQESAAIEDICRSCLSEYAKGAKLHGAKA